MAINITTALTQLGRIGRVLYLMDTGQAALPAGYTSLYAQIADAWPAYCGPIAQGQQSLTRAQSNAFGTLAIAAQQILQATVAADVPSVGASLSAALAEFRRQMIAGSQTVKACAVTASASALSGMIGSGVAVLSTKRGDGLTQEHIVAESARLACTADSYSGGRTAGQEQFQFTGATNTASNYDYDWPQGSGGSASLAAVSADQSASLTSNLLVNGNFETWAGTPLAASNWVTSNVWGTDLQRSGAAFRGSYSLQLNAGSPALYQPFGDGTNGTSVSPSTQTSYAVNFWTRTASGTASAGVLTVELVDGSGTVINDQQGTANSFTVDLTTLTTSWVAKSGVFRLPAVPPTAVRLRLRVSTALVGANVLVDDVAFAPLTAAYSGGPGVAVFSGATPFEAGDTFTITTTNDRGGASYGATFQTLFLRLFGFPSILLPSAGSPTQADTLITAP